MKTYILELSILLVLSFFSIHLNAQDDLICKPLHEGSYEHNAETYRNGKHVVMFLRLVKDKQALTINKDLNSSPINVWDLEKNKFIKMTHNWILKSDDFFDVLIYDSSRFFLNYYGSIYRADIDYNLNHIKYERLFEDTTGANDYVSFYSKGKKNTYFIIYPHLLICDEYGKIKEKKQLQFPHDKIMMYNVAEISDSIFVTFAYNSNGIKVKVGVYDSTKNGNVNYIGSEFNIDSGLEIMHGYRVNDIQVVFKNRIYIWAFNSDDYIPYLYEFYNGKWKLLIIGSFLPKYNAAGVLNVLVVSGGKYPNNEMINDGPGGHYEYDFFPETGKVGNRTIDPYYDYYSYRFDDGFEQGFYSRNKDFPFCNYYYKIGNRLIGFGNYIIAELINNNASNTQRIETSNISVYPNPTNHTINITGIESSEMYHLTDITGKTVLNGSTNGAIDISHLKSGIYLLTIQQQVVKIIK
jgi:hypothetical protein